MFTTSNVMGRVGLAAVLAVGAIVIDVVADQKPVGAVIDPNICYVVPDRGGGNGGDDRLVTFDRSTGVFAPIGAGTGTFNIEAAEVWPMNDTIYAINANELGIINRTTGVLPIVSRMLL